MCCLASRALWEFSADQWRGGPCRAVLAKLPSTCEERVARGNEARPPRIPISALGRVEHIVRRLVRFRHRPYKKGPDATLGTHTLPRPQATNTCALEGGTTYEDPTRERAPRRGGIPYPIVQKIATASAHHLSGGGGGGGGEGSEPEGMKNLR